MRYKFMALLLVSLLIVSCGSDRDPASEQQTDTAVESPEEKQAVEQTREIPDLAVILGSENQADSYAVELAFVLNIQIMSPKANEAIRGGAEIPSLVLGDEESPWWQSLGFEVEVDGASSSLVCELFPETNNESLVFSEGSYNSAIAIFAPSPEWKNKVIQISGNVTKDGRIYKSPPLAIDFSASSPEQLDVDRSELYVLLKRNEVQAAKEIAQRYIDTEPDNYHGYSMMASVNEAEKDYAAAIESYRRVITRLPEDANHDVTQFILQRIILMEEKIH